MKSFANQTASSKREAIRQHAGFGQLHESQSSQYDSVFSMTTKGLNWHVPTLSHVRDRISNDYNVWRLVHKRVTRGLQSRKVLVGDWRPRTYRSISPHVRSEGVPHET